MSTIEIERPETIARIALHNDLFRKALAYPLGLAYASSLGIRGRHMVTSGVTALGFGFADRARGAAADFDAFSDDNDPHGEHDGAFFVVTDEDGRDHKLFWKIDYFFPDGEFEWGSEDPSDPAQTVRVLTIMLSHER